MKKLRKQFKRVLHQRNHTFGSSNKKKKKASYSHFKSFRQTTKRTDSIDSNTTYSINQTTKKKLIVSKNCNKKPPKTKRTSAMGNYTILTRKIASNLTKNRNKSQISDSKKSRSRSKNSTRPLKLRLARKDTSYQQFAMPNLKVFSNKGGQAHSRNRSNCHNSDFWPLGPSKAVLANNDIKFIKNKLKTSVNMKKQTSTQVSKAASKQVRRPRKIVVHGGQNVSRAVSPSIL